MSSEDPRRLAEEARQEGAGIRAVVKKCRSDPVNHFTTHEVLDQEEKDAEWYESVARTIEQLEGALRAIWSVRDNGKSDYGKLLEVLQIAKGNLPPSPTQEEK